MAMTKTTLATATWTAIIAASTVDTLVVISGGSARLSTGATPGTTDLGFDVSAGYQIVVPAGVLLYGISVGATATAIVGPFGV